MTSASGESSHQFDEFVTDVISDQSLVGASPLPAVSEVAIAAADSSLPVAALQHLIDGVHSFTGLNWWASIALTTIMIRGATVPLLINQMRSLTKLNLMRPHLEELNQKFKETAMEPDAVSQHQQRVMALFREHGVTPFTPLKGLLIQGPIFVCFFLAIRNMAEKVPSFHTGGTLWFVDLTTPDSFFVLPILTSLTFWILVECNMQEGMEGNPMTGTMKKYCRILALVAIPVTMGFPKAIFGYWLTSNLFSLLYGTVMRQPGIKKILNIPEVLDSSISASQTTVSTTPPTRQDNFMSDPAPSPSSLKETPKFGSRRISSASVISQRIRSLQRKVKARNKAKKA
ncbi:hypothetical protein MLD38_020750 [Melastoma candidum]|uniref:Uncharacterized protein n=1 Tax=Melastoma candidum TaxID=119954 RepID=A0ACB9QDU8_9MYRT|nr:hypothetical protein MLD38_020750 [Melastoma candidum]